MAEGLCSATLGVVDVSSKRPATKHPKIAR